MYDRFVLFNVHREDNGASTSVIMILTSPRIKI